MPSPVPMGMSIEAYIEILHLQDLMNVNRMAVAAVADGEGSASGRMLAGITLEALEAVRGRSPFLYGVLKTAHRAEISPSKGRIFIDPSVTHPVLGGRPVEYGPKVHLRKPWFSETIEYDIPGIVERHVEKFVQEIEVLYG